MNAIQPPDAAEDTDDDNKNKPEDSEDESEKEVEEALTYKIVKTAPFPKTVISTLAHNYKTPDFLYYLQNS